MFEQQRIFVHRNYNNFGGRKNIYSSFGPSNDYVNLWRLLKGDKYNKYLKP